MHLKSRYGTRLETKLSVPLFSRPEIERTTLEMCPKRVHFSNHFQPSLPTFFFLEKYFFSNISSISFHARSKIYLKLNIEISQRVSLPTFFFLEKYFFPIFLRSLSMLKMMKIDQKST